jgi:hypothetical protein
VMKLDSKQQIPFRARAKTHVRIAVRGARLPGFDAGNGPIDLPPRPPE